VRGLQDLWVQGIGSGRSRLETMLCMVGSGQSADSIGADAGLALGSRGVYFRLGIFIDIG
jgi:hypothetical protein